MNHGRVALAALVVAVALASGVGTAAGAQASLSDPQPIKDPGEERIVKNAPVELNVTVSTTGGPVTVEFQTARGTVIGSQTVSSGGVVSVSWDADVGAREWRAVVRDGSSGAVLDATSEQELTVTERDPDAICLEFRVELQDRNLFCAAAGPFTGVLPLPVLGMVVWGALSLGLFIRTGSPVLPYVLLLLTGGAIGGVLAGPVLSLVTVLLLAVTGGVPLLLYIQYAR